MADKAERHELYEEAVQCVEAEIDFVDATFKQMRGRTAKRLREDFCGTASASCEWVRRRKTNRATGVDIDPEVLAWGRDHRLAKLSGDQRKRIELINEDVLKSDADDFDMVLAMNFSYWVFKQRQHLRRYFRAVYESLADDGIMFLDSFGGHEAFKVMREKRKYKGFTYIWDQADYNPITGDILCHIHFRFKDGSKMNKAFSYDWRLWTVAEIRELLEEAGFRRSTVYWEGTDEETGEGNGEFTATERGEADAGWVAYLSAEK